METRFRNYVYKGIYQAKIEEMKDTYLQQGFKEKFPDNSMDRQFDLLLQHRETGKTLAFDVGFYPISKEHLDRLDIKKQYAIEQGYDFRIITIVRRSNITNQINWLQPAFYQYVNAHLPDVLTQQEEYKGLEDASIFVVSVNINDDIAQVETEGSLEAIIGDNGSTYTESFPFIADMTLNLAKHSIEQADLKVDDSLFY